MLTQSTGNIWGWVKVSTLSAGTIWRLSWEYQKGVCQWWDWSGWLDALWEGLWEVLQDWLWLGLWWHDCLLGDWLEQCPLHLGLLFPGNLACLGLLAPLELLSPCWGCCGMVTGSSSAYTGQCSGLVCCRHSRIVPWLDIDLEGGNSHICCSRGKWIEPQHEWGMLRRSLW